MRDLEHARLQKVAHVRAVVEMFYFDGKRGFVAILDLLSQLSSGDGVPFPETDGDPAKMGLGLERL